MSSIIVKNVSKKFARDYNVLRRVGARSLLKQMLGIHVDNSRLHPGEFWATKEVSFEVHQGQTLGILGLNGSGKSTLLKMINGLYLPDSGSIEVEGKVEALIELGTGFHPNLSGKENVYIKCALNGLSREDTDAIYDKIVEFAELEEFITMPVKNYSSGMYARLGFATSIFGSPDVMLIDEVLSVGDFTFSQKCLDKLNEIKRDTAVIFVSHSLPAMKMFCDRGIVMEKGSIVYSGHIDDAVSFYSERYDHKKQKKSTDSSVMGEEFENAEKLTDFECKWTDESGQEKAVFAKGERILLNFSFRLTSSKPNNFLIGVPVWNQDNVLVSAFASDRDKVEFPFEREGDRVFGKLIVENHFNSGQYRAIFAASDGPEYFLRMKLPEFQVKDYHPRDLGACLIKHEWDISSLPPQQTSI